MTKGTPMKGTATTPEEYVESLSGWQRELVAALRAAVRADSRLAEGLKWGHLVYHAGGPVLAIRAEPERVLFAFWRGQRLRLHEPRLKPGGRYEMATLELRSGEEIAAETASRLAAEAVALNLALGDPTREAKPRAAGVRGAAGTGARAGNKRKNGEKLRAVKKRKEGQKGKMAKKGKVAMEGKKGKKGKKKKGKKKTSGR